MENDEAPGNLGLYDQILALQWVNKYIAHFGGNPNQITIAGQSAGAASAMYLIDSPMAKGLFHSAIAASGDNLAGWAVQKNPKAGALKAAGKLGCHNSSDASPNTTAVLNCLRSLPPSKLLEANTAFYVWSVVLSHSHCEKVQ